MRYSKEWKIENVNIVLQGERLEQVEKFWYLGVDVEAGRSMEVEKTRSLEEGAKVFIKSVYRSLE